MQIFEFHFNPKAKEDVIFDTFCYEAENVYEKRLGNLHMAGFLKNALPQNKRFLDSLAKLIKENYYKTISGSPEKSLKETLKKANEHLEKTAKAGDVSWLGNLSFAVISILNQELNFTKVGDIKLYLIRKNQLIDIDKKIRFDEIEPYPLKIFGNIVSGKLAEDDIVLALTRDVANIFSQENLLNQIANISPFESKKLKEIINDKKEKLTSISGTCLIIVSTKEKLPKEKEAFVDKRPLKIFSFKKLTPSIPFKTLGKRALNSITNKLPKFSPKISLGKPRLSLKLPKPKLKFKHLRFNPTLKTNFKAGVFPVNKKMALIVSLIVILTIGYFISGILDKKDVEKYREQLILIEEKVDRAEAYLLIAETKPQARKDANSLLKESWDEIAPLTEEASKFPEEFEKEILDLEERVSESLFQINKLTIVNDPDLFFEFDSKEFSTQKMVRFGNNLYFFNSFSESMAEINLETKEKKLYPIPNKDQKFSLAASLSNSVLFFSKPNQLFSFKDGEFSETINLKNLSYESNFTNLASYYSNLYFFEENNGKIIKYGYGSGLNWGGPQNWLAENQSVTNGESITIDRSIWVLDKENSIEKYYTGELEKKLELNIFPYPKDFSKIFTSLQLPYLYILEPAQKRIIVISKKTEAVTVQFQSEKFDNLLDFAVSSSGKTIFLLNNQKVYQVSF